MTTLAIFAFVIFPAIVVIFPAIAAALIIIIDSKS